jgi:branched-chain amino acid transport system substrate-binding protein
MELIDNDLGPIAAGGIARTVEASGADCAITVITSGSGRELIPALNGSDQPPRVFSHWGILGGEFVNNVPHSIREGVDLRVLQTCGLEVERDGSPLLERLLSGISEPAVEDQGLGGMKAPAGFVHGHDLTMILAAAIRQAAKTPEWAQGPKARRTAIKRALEALEEPVPGILRTYSRPFAPMTARAYDAHEALGEDDLCMASFNRNGNLVAVPRPSADG